MRGKKSIILASIFAGLGLVGATFATVTAWAVTDNANPLGIKVSPGNVDTDTTTGYTTLEWGAQKSLSNVGNLKLNSKRLAGILDVRQSAAEAFPGRLSYYVTGSADLISSLEIEIWKGEIKAGLIPGNEIEVSDWTGSTAVKQTLGELTTEQKRGRNETKGVNISALADNAANLYSVVVYLKDTVTPDAYAALASASVDITFDWCLSSEATPVTTVTYYLTAGGLDNDDKTPHAYAWAGDGSARNGAFPGVAMTHVSGHVYSIEIDASKYDKIIFNDGLETAGVQSGDILLSEFTTNNMFTYDGKTGTAKGEFGVYTPVVADKVYYLVGENITHGGVDVTWSAAEAHKLTLTAGTVTFQIHNNGEGRLKIFESTNGDWISNDGNDFVIHDAGDYNIQFKANPGESESYIACV